MTKILQAEAVISATDKTGKVFDQVAAKAKRAATEAAKASAAANKSVGDIGEKRAAYWKWGKGFDDEIARLKLTAAQIDRVHKSYADFHRELAKNPMSRRFGVMADSVKDWETKTIGSLRKVAAAQERHERIAARAGLIANRVGGALIGGYVASRAAKYVGTVAGESERENARGYLAGLSDAENKSLKVRAAAMSAQYPSVTTTTFQERLRDTALAMRSTPKAMELADTIAQGTVVLQSLKGKDQAIEEGRKFFKALDTLGKNIDPEEVKGLFNGYVKALGVEGADLNLGDLFELAKRSKSAGASLSPRFLTSTAPGLIGDVGASETGTALGSEIAQLIAGRGTKASKAAQVAFGMRDSKGRVVDEQRAMTDPDLYAWNTIIPLLQKRGIDPDDETAVVKQMAAVFSNQVVANLFTKLITQRAQYQGKAQQYDKAPGLSAAAELPKRDPFVALEGVTSQINNLVSTLADPHVGAATRNLETLSGAIAKFTSLVAARNESAQTAPRPEQVGANDPRRGIVAAASRVNFRESLELPELPWGGAGSLPWWRQPEGQRGDMSGWRTYADPRLSARGGDHVWPSLADQAGLKDIGSVKAEIEGNATLETNVTVKAAPYFWTEVDQRVDNKINAFRRSGGQPSTGSTGSTGKAMPEVGPSP